jgi:hypothetical protein
MEREKTIWFRIRPSETDLPEADIMRDPYSSPRRPLPSFVKLGWVEPFSVGAGDGRGGRRRRGVVEAEGD